MVGYKGTDFIMIVWLNNIAGYPSTTITLNGNLFNTIALYACATDLGSYVPLNKHLYLTVASYKILHDSWLHFKTLSGDIP